MKKVHTVYDITRASWWMPLVAEAPYSAYICIYIYIYSLNIWMATMEDEACKNPGSVGAMLNGAQ